MLAHLNIIYGPFYSTTAHLGNCHRDRQRVTQPGMLTVRALAQNIPLCVLCNRQAQELVVCATSLWDGLI